MADGEEVIVKLRDETDRAGEKTAWAAEMLPRLGARGYPVPEIVWHGALDAERHVTVVRRLPGLPVQRVDDALLTALLDLVSLQADAGVDAGARNMAEYHALVLFEGWDHEWRDAEAASEEARAICARLRHWLRPVWGHRLEPADFAHEDLNFTNILCEGGRITGIVDWDEFGLNSRAADLAGILFDVERLRLAGAADGPERLATLLLDEVVRIGGDAGLRCTIAYAAVARLAHAARGRDAQALSSWVEATARTLDRVGG